MGWLQDLGKTLVNVVTLPVTTITGRPPVYPPAEMDTEFFQAGGKIAKVTTALSALVTGAAVGTQIVKGTGNNSGTTMNDKGNFWDGLGETIITGFGNYIGNRQTQQTEVQKAQIQSGALVDVVRAIAIPAAFFAALWFIGSLIFRKRK